MITRASRWRRSVCRRCLRRTAIRNSTPAQGVIKEIAYMGDTSIFIVLLDSGKRVRVTQPNTHRHADEPADLGRARVDRAGTSPAPWWSRNRPRGAWRRSATFRSVIA